MGKATNIEQFAPDLLLSLTGLEKAKPDGGFLTLAHNKARDGYDALSGMGSFNHQQMLHAVQLWDEGAAAADWWRGYFRLQLGMDEPKAGQEQMGFFAGNEPLGPSYEPFRWGSVLAVRLWALKNHDDELLELTGRYAEVVSTLCALGAVPFAEKVQFFNQRKRRLNYDGPYVSPVGERSNQHGASDLCPLFASSIGWDYQYFPQPDWPLAIARKLNGDLGVSPDLAAALKQYVEENPGPVEPLQQALAGIKIKADQHFVRWKDALLVYKPRRINGNTPCYLYMWLPYEEQTAALIYPWPPGRGANVRGSGRCWIDSERRISVATQFEDLCPSPFELPADEPVSVLSIGPDGLITGQSLESLFAPDKPEDIDVPEEPDSD